MAWDAHVPELSTYGRPLVGCLLLFAAFDFLVARHTRARYFTVHVLANSIVVYCTLPALLALLDNPLKALASDEFSALAMSANLAIHVYHVLAFDNLLWIDWLHHGTMTGIVSPLVMTYDRFFGPVLDAMNFFICGLPGGLDYAMLACVKHGWMTSLQEKRYNMFLNTWVRPVGVIVVCGFGYVQAYMKDPTASWLEPAALHELTIFGLLIWNSQFFGQRVIGNYHVRLYQQEQKEKLAKQQEQEEGKASERNGDVSHAAKERSPATNGTACH